MSLTFTRAVWGMKGLRPPVKFVALALAEHADDHGICWPSIARLAEMTELAKSTVAAALTELEEMSVIVRSRSSGGQRRSTRYRLIPLGESVETIHRADSNPTESALEPSGSRTVINNNCPGGGAQLSGSRTATVREPDTNRNRTTKNLNSYTDDFEIAWSEYPQRAGGNSKSDAFKAWNARLREGHKPEDMIAGVKRYRLFCDAAERTGTAFVKQAASFFGPSDPPHFLEASAPTQKQTTKNRTQLPRSDGDLEPWARANGFGSSRPGETYQQYRVRLQREADQREREAA